MNILISMKKEMFATSEVGCKGINDSLRIFNFYTRPAVSSTQYNVDIYIHVDNI